MIFRCRSKGFASRITRSSPIMPYFSVTLIVECPKIALKPRERAACVTPLREVVRGRADRLRVKIQSIATLQHMAIRHSQSRFSTRIPSKPEKFASENGRYRDPVVR